MVFPHLAAQLGAGSGLHVAAAIGGVSNLVGQYFGNQGAAIAANQAQGLPAFSNIGFSTGLREIALDQVASSAAFAPLVTLQAARLGIGVRNLFYFL